jgi:hypothetical protein
MFQPESLSNKDQSDDIIRKPSEVRPSVDGEQVSREQIVEPSPKRRDFEYSRTPKERDLESGDSEDLSGLLGYHVNETLVIKIKDDGTGLFKPRSGERAVTGLTIEAGTYYKRERAAYIVDRFLGFGLVPTTVIRDEARIGIGSNQEFIEDTRFIWELSGIEKIEMGPQVNLLSLFDLIIWNCDRHKGNYLFKGDSVVAIDNGFSFSGREPVYVCSEERSNSVNFPIGTKEKIKKLVEWEDGLRLLKELLSELIAEEEAQDCIDRIKELDKLLERERGNVFMHYKFQDSSIWVED